MCRTYGVDRAGGGERRVNVSDADSSESEGPLSEVEELRAENARLRSLLGLDQPSRREDLEPWEPSLLPQPVERAVPREVDQSSSAESKVALFRFLFAGREDVHAVRWESARTGKSGWSPVVVGGWANAKKPGRTYEPLTNDVVDAHLSGGAHVGLYPLLHGDECRLLACDFDGSGWALDALAYVDAASSLRDSCSAGAFPVGRWGAHMDVLFRAGSGRFGPPYRRAYPPRGDGGQS